MKIKYNKKSKYELNEFIILIFILIVGLFFISRYISIGLPQYLAVDENITTNRVLSMYKNNNFKLDYFLYPGFNFYYGLIGLKILNIFTDVLVNQIYNLRIIYVGSAVISYIFIYFAIKKCINTNKKIAALGLLFAVSSLYIPQCIYFCGPDILIILSGNFLIYLAFSINFSDNYEKNIYFYYPIFCIITGIITATKFHGFIFVFLLLYLHIKKGYIKSYKFNFILLICLVFIPLIFCLCNIYMFANFEKFIDDILWNVKHYSGAHMGLDNNMPFISYIKFFVFSGFGTIGGIFLVLGIFYLIKNKKYNILILNSIVPLSIILLLSQYKLVLQRNISFAMSFSYIFMVFGVIQLYCILNKLFSKKEKADKISIYIISFIVFICVSSNFYAMWKESSLNESRFMASEFIQNNIPEGSVISIKGPIPLYFPTIDNQKFILEGNDYEIQSGEYRIESSFQFSRLFKKNLKLFGEGNYMYEKALNNYENELKGYTLIKEFKGTENTLMSKFKDLSLSFPRIIYSEKNIYSGPTIRIYVKD